ncbi:hypothetical protein SAMN05421776_11757 [Nocardia farcinica]|uniref:Phage tail protein n=1 Tax=Nocardia farcinica TaxID=37329 RepID=A0A0H5NWN6_NOCFR|nr:hypothetical protein [Nocardia farcinica]AXK86595.1 phage tail protein [Nocardia farcinica]PFW99064.1 hypothetical protein CJ469_05664 [Nocardia farcinica]PFX06102.1 hypothetical protein CJ468_04962 [Nocardia farcinica]CRY79887.1 Uncharacterised protein [Nocardia farcinica]SIT33652.1 hypothetical protein SAMN05421776_11757 [Nocardia farcinica]
MPTDTSKVYVPSAPKVKGVIYRAPLGTALPTDAVTALAAAYVDQGGISDAGIVNAMAREVQKIKDFGGKTIATPQSDYSETLKVEFVEAINLETLKTVFGTSNVTFTPATANKGALITVDHNSAPLPESVIVTETVQGTGVRRQVAPIAKPITVDDVSQVSTDAVKYAVTFECFEYVDGDTAFHIREFIDDGVFATTP